MGLASTGDRFHVYDTTLRDGAQQEGLSLSVHDKLAIARHLDELGVGFIEGGWPGAIPKDTEFFKRAQTELGLSNAQPDRIRRHAASRASASQDDPLGAGSGRGRNAGRDVGREESRRTRNSGRCAPPWTRTSRWWRNTVAFLAGLGPPRVPRRRALLRRLPPRPATTRSRSCGQPREAGAELVALCDTNGGLLPDDVGEIVAAVNDGTGIRLGIHCHNDTGCAVANSLAAVDAGATHVQGTLNGYGERTGNADLVTLVANLELKRGLQVLPDGALREATRIAHAVSEVTNVVPYSRQPYVGASAFAHKAGLHASAIKVDPDLHQHANPEQVGNDMRMLVSDMAGRASIELKGRELGYDLSTDRELVSRVTDRVKALEAQGYTFEAADASFELLLRAEADGVSPQFFEVESWRVITESRPRSEAQSEATVKVRAGGERAVVTGEGNGPVNALDHALRTAIGTLYPEIDKLQLIDYKVRILDAAHGSDAVTRVLVEMTDGEELVGNRRHRRQHRRGVLGGAGRRGHLRATPAGRRTASMTRSSAAGSAESS